MPLASKGFYDKSEQQKIIDYIIDKNYYFDLRGTAVWQEMEKLQICPRRTWRSMEQHFRTIIINGLDSLDVTEAERKRILDCYYNKYKHTFVKRKRLPCSGKDDENHDVPKKSKTQNSDEENKMIKQKEVQECDSAIIQSRDYSNNEKIDQINQEIFAKPNNVEDDDDIQNRSGMALDSSSEVSYSEEEDKNIIIYIKENMNWAELQYFDDIYENCKKEVLLKRSAASIKNRFLNVILPNLCNYHILDVQEIPLFYDRVGIDIPSEFEQILNDWIENNKNTSNNSKEDQENNAANLSVDSIVTENNKKVTETFILNSADELKNNVQECTVDTSEYKEKANVENNNNENVSANNENEDLNYIPQKDTEGESIISKLNPNTSQKYQETCQNINKNNCTDKIVNSDDILQKENVSNKQIELPNSSKNDSREESTIYNNIAVQTNTDNFKVLVKFVGGQFCLNINSEEHVFIPDSNNSFQGIIRELTEQYNIISENIHIIKEKYYNDFQILTKKYDILDTKILNLKNKVITESEMPELLSLNYEDTNLLKLICTCFSKGLNKSDNERKSRTVHLPIKKSRNTKCLENKCECRGETNNKKLKTKTNSEVLLDHEINSLNNKAEDYIINHFPTNSEEHNMDAGKQIDISDHSSPIITTSRRNRINVVHLNDLISANQHKNTVDSNNVTNDGFTVADNSRIKESNYVADFDKTEEFGSPNCNSTIKEEFIESDDDNIYSSVYSNETMIYEQEPVTEEAKIMDSEIVVLSSDSEKEELINMAATEIKIEAMDTNNSPYLSEFNYNNENEIRDDAIVKEEIEEMEKMNLDFQNFLSDNRTTDIMKIKDECNDLNNETNISYQVNNCVSDNINNTVLQNTKNKYIKNILLSNKSKKLLKQKNLENPYFMQ